MMHIPDGMLSAPVVATTGVTSAGLVAYAVRWVRTNLDPQRVVLMAVMAALVFALQMLNFPVAGGTSGHFAGGAAAAILLGPWPAAIVLTTVLLIQAFLFADGGVLALGANVLNLAVIAPFTGFIVWRALSARSGTRKAPVSVGAFAAAWVAVVAAASAVAIEIWVSGRAPLGLVLPAMFGWHALIGVGEGLITAALVAYVLSVRPDIVSERPGAARTGIRGVAVTLGAVTIAAAGLSFLASSSPDGLEYVYFEEGIGAPFAAKPLLASPLDGYLVPGIHSEAVAGALAGIVGAIVVGLLAYTLAMSARRRRPAEPSPRSRTS